MKVKQKSRTAILSKIAFWAGTGILVSALFASPAFAETKIHEVQPWDIDKPTQLIIWGTDFGPISQSEQTPVIYFGTDSVQLNIAAAADQANLCPHPLATIAPPLELTGMDCVVVDLPLATNGEPNVPAGDYLLQIWVETDEVACAKKPNELRFEYNPAGCLDDNLQDAVCEGTMLGSLGPVDLTAGGHNNAVWDVSPGNTVANGTEVTFTAGVNDKGQTKWPNQLNLDITDGTLSQRLEIHTSCSEPLIIGETYGSATLTYINETATGAITQHDLYDLTLGAVGPEGPAGEVGPKGDTGEAGPKGDTGEAGPKGDKGDTGPKGDKGEAGPKGDTGEAGPKGDKGDAGPKGDKGDTGPKGDKGDTGPKGDKGDTGAQGPAGPDGATGAQGPAGPDGATGARGPAGPDGATGAQGPAGPAGSDGADGAPGLAGADGSDGATGPEGPTGPTGPQGDKGDAGSQGPAGLDGADGAPGLAGADGSDGATGAEGPTGPAGPQGATGTGQSLLCFATDQTIGAQGKYMGLGQQGGSHAEVGVILPEVYNGGTVTGFVIKVSQGNTARDGQAWVYHDDELGGDGGHIAMGPCEIVATEGEATTVCPVPPSYLVGDTSHPLGDWDSLSVFVKTAGGSFEGATACVLVSPPAAP